ncbi:RNA polymerase sigma-70 factor, ECF subfamily [bacterium A37T11]|nr:RNA polymerase sigma-70 factor, ECF subfamily [bacterium A37T11]
MSPFTPGNDQELLQALRRGDERAFTQLYNQYWSSLYATAYNRLRDREQCQDLVQELFTDVWKRRESLEATTLGAYLHSAMRFMTYKRLAKMPLETRYYQEFEETIASSLFTDDQLLTKELRQLLDHWIEALPEKRRKVFLLHYEESLSTEEIATRLGVSRKTVQNQLNTVYTHLQQKYMHYLLTGMILTLLTAWIS